MPPLLVICVSIFIPSEDEYCFNLNAPIMFTMQKTEELILNCYCMVHFDGTKQLLHGISDLVSNMYCMDRNELLGTSNMVPDMNCMVLLTWFQT